MFLTILRYGIPSTALFLDTVLLVLIAFCTKKNIKAYRFSLLQNCIIDFVFSLVGLIFGPGVDAKNGLLYFFIHPVFETNSTPLIIYAVVLFLFTLNLYFTTIPIQFVNRYIYLTQFRAIDLETHIKFSYPAVAASAFLSVSMFGAFRDSDNHYNESLANLESDPFYADEIPHYITSDNKNPVLMTYFAAIIILAIVVSGVIIYCNKFVFDRLNRIRKFIRMDTVKAAQQISNVLTWQIFVMLVFYLTPTIVLIGAVYTSLSDFTVVLMFIVPFFQLAPVVNAVAAILCIKCYRAGVTCNNVNVVNSLDRESVSENVSIPPFECEMDQHVESVAESTI